MKCMLTVVAFGLCCIASLPTYGGLEWEKQRVRYVASIADEKAEVPFVFTNTGEQSVTINSVRTSCGCTTATLSKTIYEPGESGKITVIFVFGDRIGKQRKRITVKTSELNEDGEPIEQSTSLELRVTIPEAVKIRPRLVYWRQDEELAPKTLKITIDHEEPIHVSKVTSDNDLFTVELKTLEEGKLYELVLTPVIALDTQESDSEDEGDGEKEDTIKAEGDGDALYGDTDALPVIEVPSRSVITITTNYPKDNPRSYTVMVRIMGRSAK